MNFSPQQLKQMETQGQLFITVLKANPQLLYKPELAFFKDYLLSLGATLPEPPKPEPAPEKPKSAPAPAPTSTATVEEVDDLPDLVSDEEVMEEEVVEPMPVFDDADLWDKWDETADQDMGDSTKEISDEDASAAMQSFSAARQAMNAKEFEDSIAKFTAAINLNPTKGILLASRADCFYRMRKPIAAIKDCDAALKINPDQSKAYKVKGKCLRFMGKYEEALKELFSGNKLDWDEDTDSIIKTIKSHVEAVVERRRADERKNQEQERARKIAAYESRKKAAEAARKRAEEEAEMGGSSGMPGGMGGMPGGGMPAGLQDILSDPEVAAALQDPVLSKKLMEIMSNPGAAMKYANDPKIASLLAKFAPLMSQMGGMGGGAAPSGMPGGGFGGPSPDEDIDLDVD